MVTRVIFNKEVVVRRTVTKVVRIASHATKKTVNSVEIVNRRSVHAVSQMPNAKARSRMLSTKRRKTITG